MKNLLALLSACLLLLSCSGDKEDDPTPSGSTNSGTPSTLTAKVTGYDAVSYNSATADANTTVSAGRIPTSDPEAAPYIMRLYAGSNSKNIIINLMKFNGKGTYVLKSNYNGSQPTPNSATYNDGMLAYGTSIRPGAGIVQGQVVVTSYDEATRRIKGTFYFTADSYAIPPGTPKTRQITDGAFDLAVTL